MDQPSKPVLMTVAEVSTVLRIHRAKVYDFIHEGLLCAFKLGSDWRVRTDSVEKIAGPIPAEIFEDAQLKAA